MSKLGKQELIGIQASDRGGTVKLRVNVLYLLANDPKVVLSPDDQRFASASDDGTVKVWDATH